LVRLGPGRSLAFLFAGGIIINYIIRKFETEDRLAVRRISCETSFLEHPRDLIFDDDEVLADALTLYFTDYEPGSCFVAVQDNKVVGYIIGAKNVIEMEKISNSKIIGPLLMKAAKRGVFFRLHNVKFFLNIFKSLLKGEFYMPNFKEEFPAMLHINLAKEFRGKGIGRRLIETYLDFLKKEGIPGVHFGTSSERAKDFFLKTGFTVLFRSKRTYFKPYFGEEINFYVLGRIL
jgi:GNAT superfamily N-acetyltransferase